MTELEEKTEKLRIYMRELGSCAVAFSSGVDSTFLLYIAHEVLGDKCLALTAKSCSFPGRELGEAVAFCEERGIRHQIIETNELEVEGFKENPPDRCYICKKALFGKMLSAAKAAGIADLVEGSNLDDEGDYRPGLAAIKELAIKSPLRACGFTKAEIRAASKRFGLPTWEKPSFACLSTRFAYGETITAEKLQMVEKAEQQLFDLGFAQFRVRIHGNIARIEVLPEDFVKLMENRERIVSEFRKYGFSYVAMDLQGYRMGSMNETLNLSQKED